MHIFSFLCLFFGFLFGVHVRFLVSMEIVRDVYVWFLVSIEIVHDVYICFLVSIEIVGDSSQNLAHHDLVVISFETWPS